MKKRVTIAALTFTLVCLSVVPAFAGCHGGGYGSGYNSRAYSPNYVSPAAISGSAIIPGTGHYYNDGHNHQMHFYNDGHNTCYRGW